MTNVLSNYKKFVDGVTSPASKDTEEFIKSLMRLEKQGCNIARIDTAFTGLCSESGEANDLVKKLKFHGKDWSPEIREHLIRELGDIGWYWMQACIALDVDPQSIFADNVKKLEARYPGGKFDIHHSENRAEDDI